MKKTYDAKLVQGFFVLNRSKGITFCAEEVREVFNLPKNCTELTFELTDLKPRDDKYHALKRFTPIWGGDDYSFEGLVRSMKAWNPILSAEVTFMRREFPKADTIYLSVYA